MKFSAIKSLLLASCFMLSTNANAGLIDITGGTFGTIPSGNVNEGVPIVYGTATRDGYYGATVGLSGSTSGYHLTFDFLGFEAAFANEFNVGATEVFSTESQASNNIFGNLAQFITTSAGSLAFSFDYDSDTGSVANGSNPDDSAGGVGPNFFVSCDDVAANTSCDSVVLWFDDGGAGPDDNHDDFAVRITARVPEPSTIALLGLGLIGLSLTNLRKKA